MTFEENKQRTIITFQKLIIPKAMDLGWFDGAVPVCSEIETAEPCVAMDYFGTDWYVIIGIAKYGISARAQFGKNAVYDKERIRLPFNTFTVRSKKVNGADTELQKYQEAIKHGGDRPYWVIQAYLDSESPTGQENILSMAMGRLEDVMQMIENGFFKRYEINLQDGTEFIPVDWEWMKRNHYEVKTWRR